MKMPCKRIAILALIFLGTQQLIAQKTTLSRDSILAIAKDAYVYVAPLIYTDATRMASSISDNIFSHQRVFPDYTFKKVVAPNNDTNYSLAFLNLEEEPIVIVTPDTKGRYIVTTFLDAWTNNFSLIGSRYLGTKSQKLFVTGPNWKGKIPKEFRHIASPTNLVWIIGRIQVNNKNDQQQNVSKLQDEFRLTTFSKWKNGDTASLPYQKKIYYQLPSGQFKEGVAAGVKTLPIADFFNYANALLTDNPPFATDSTIVQRIRKIGVGKGEKFSLSSFDSITQNVLNALTGKIYQHLGRSAASGIAGNNAMREKGLGNFGTDYAFRFLVAVYGLGALPPEEAIYIDRKVDEQNISLNGENHYVVHFAKGELPPAKAFWSITLYNQDRYLSQNEIGRYAIGNRDALNFNADGSLDIYVGHERPSEEKLSNWLPAPDGSFYLITRIYVPQGRYLKDRNTWQHPNIQKIAHY